MDTKDNMTDVAEIADEVNDTEPSAEVSDGQVTDSDGNVVTLDN